MTSDDPRWTATLAWDELLCEIGAMCEMDHTWCTIHASSGRNGRCSTGRAIDDMAVALTGLHRANGRWGERVVSQVGHEAVVRGWDRNGKWLWLEHPESSTPGLAPADTWQPPVPLQAEGTQP